MSISPDSQAIALLASAIAVPRDGSVRPLGPRGWSSLAQRLDRAGLVPGDLFGRSASDIASTLELEPAVAERVATLLERGGQLAFELERLEARGIWLLTLVDDAYPWRLQDRLGGTAPPVLFGAGRASLLDGGGVAIVGSRDADRAAVEFTRALASAAVREAVPVVSGGARGIDAAAMAAAFESGGTVVGALADSLERRIREPETRRAIAADVVVLVTPYQPSAPFSAGAAMGRNKHIYALADAAVVVSSALDSGGTWTGALEAMEAGWVPVFVRDGDVDLPAGNRELIAQGAMPFDQPALWRAIHAGAAHRPTPPSQVAEAREAYQGTLFEDI